MEELNKFKFLIEPVLVSPSITGCLNMNFLGWPNALKFSTMGCKYAIKPPRPRSNFFSGALRSNTIRCLTDELIFSFGRPGNRISMLLLYEQTIVKCLRFETNRDMVLSFGMGEEFVGSPVRLGEYRHER